MATLREIRQRITGVKNTAKITSAMKMVAAAKMRRAQEAIFAARPYSEKLQEMLSLLAVGLDDISDPLLEQRETVSSVAVIVISADRGLCGGFNSSVARATLYHLKNKLPEKYPNAQFHVLPVGKKSCDFLRKEDFPIIAEYPQVFARLDFVDAHAIAKTVMDGFISGEFDRVEIIGNEFRSVAKQEVTINQFLPIEPSTDVKNENDTPEQTGTEYFFEPSQEEVLKALLPKHLNMQVWRMLLESNAAEQAARMMAMDNATVNAKSLIDDLTLRYNKARQAAITTEILEIVSGAEALANS
jgi:F-type H+-transporting ATPase subunit gamma